MRHFSRFRKPGSVLIEYLVTIPLFMLMAWFPMQIMFFSLSQSTAQSSAMEGARYLSMELNGFQGSSLDELPASQKTQVIKGLESRVQAISEYNSTFLLYRDKDRNVVKPKVVTDKNTCKSALSNSANKRVVCAYLDTPTSSSQPQTVVQVKGEYQIIGNLIPGLQGKFFAKGLGVSILNRSERYQYY
ncbi:hypothetical protein bcgnr5378_29750 [Bacillus cereus]|uniref:TadE-like domain-containing protein n=1 Tax=Bacillus cereus TaxID=1396 RepID=A0A164QSY3_BACCE|nr:TadE family protein [Bacillus cereus]KZD72138.1 hypothetical protein B4088_0599 [Bacillus cereus]GCF70836.1 hypothetical protein BC2903_46550 [Bacillus cereus]HDR8324593.1 pilus assembly protein [Bacillus cereus]HDR8330792.1 pilus assembly protein [Bacillus cereus]HDR8332951.1 pilus assembly protein [Bacillus cereus]